MTNKTFKDFIYDDLDVFFNLDEMAELHLLEGSEIPLVVVDSKNSSNDRNGFSRQQIYASQEVFKHVKTIYVKSCDFYIPKVDSTINLDDEEYSVDDAGEENGIIRIVLSSNES